MATHKNTGAMTEEEAQAIALKALIWMLGDERRANRLLAPTGLTPAALRDQLTERAVQAAILDHLSAYEPDLLAFAEQEVLDASRVMHAANMLTD